MGPEARHGKPFIYMTFRSSAALSDIPVILCHRRQKGAEVPGCPINFSLSRHHAGPCRI
jgi:hypothetical protein